MPRRSALGSRRPNRRADDCRLVIATGFLGMGNGAPQREKPYTLGEINGHLQTMLATLPALRSPPIFRSTQVISPSVTTPSYIPHQSGVFPRTVSASTTLAETFGNGAKTGIAKR